MAEKVRIIDEAELEIQKDYSAKITSILESRYNSKPLACVVTYGCQQNVADSEKIKGMLSVMGYDFT